MSACSVAGSTSFRSTQFSSIWRSRDAASVIFGYRHRLETQLLGGRRGGSFMENNVIADSGQQDDTKKGLDNTSHPGRPGSDELVPSRYALRVGKIDVLVVSDGVLPIAAETIAYNVDATVRTAWLEDMFLPPDMLDWPLNVVVVRSGGRTILIDAGIGVDPGLNLPRAGRLVPRLEAAGIDLASVTDVVLTHMHMDHIGGLLVDGVKDRLRRDLRVHLAAAEAKFWEAPDFSRAAMPPPIPDVLRGTAKRFLNEYHSQLRPFEYEV